MTKEFQNNRMSLQQNPVTEKPFKHVDTAGIVLLVLKINLFFNFHYLF